ncbi:MAG TPA: radical SAM protein [Planctomycetota bacterium]|nr:radical SAM protein [Planctomycetota bacterium]
MRLNPCELAVDLYCRGVAIGGDLPRGLSRTRAGLGSGLELVLPGTPPLRKDVRVNAPVTERFVRDTPFVFRGSYLLDRRTGEAYTVRVPPEPAWYDRPTSSGKLMREIGVMQGTYLAIYVGVSCTFWRQGLECRFCTTGLNENLQSRKTVEDVVETALAAKEESGVTFVHLNTGYQGGAAGRIVLPYVEALKRRVGVLVGVQIAPEAPRFEFDALIDAGADHFSFCFEYMDPAVFARLCPGKEQALGQDAFFRALEHCQGRMPKGSCSGEIIAGNEPVERTMEAIDWITSVGAFPTVCVFRPLKGSAMEHEPPPRYEDMRRVMKHMWERCRDRSIPIGLAPNIEVSLVVQPTDAAYLADGTFKDRWYMWKLGLLRRLAAPVFRRRMRPQPV